MMMNNLNRWLDDQFLNQALASTEPKQPTQHNTPMGPQMFLVKDLNVGDSVQTVADLKGGYTDSNNKYHAMTIPKNTIGKLAKIEPTLETVIFWVEFVAPKGERQALPLLPHTIKKYQNQN